MASRLAVCASQCTTVGMWRAAAVRIISTPIGGHVVSSWAGRGMCRTTFRGPGSSQTPVSQRKYIVFDRSPRQGLCAEQALSPRRGY